jgi:cell division protease FtsH
VGNARNIAFWVVLFLLILALFNAFGGNQSTTASRTVSYSEFIQRVDAGEVASATIDGERVVATDTTGNRFATVAPNDPKLTERLIDKVALVNSHQHRPEEIVKILLRDERTRILHYFQEEAKTDSYRKAMSKRTLSGVTQGRSA